MTVAFGEGRSFLYVLDKKTYNNSYYGKNHDKNLIVTHQHHLLSPQGRGGGNRLSVRVTPQDLRLSNVLSEYWSTCLATWNYLELIIDKLRCVVAEAVRAEDDDDQK